MENVFMSYSTRDFEELAEDLSDFILSKLRNPLEYALFGYSMGSIACVEVLKKLIWS